MTWDAACHNKLQQAAAAQQYCHKALLYCRRAAVPHCRPALMYRRAVLLYCRTAQDEGFLPAWYTAQHT
eukprot:362649-Chlamydomonas_euryale.AAC.6